MNKKQAAFVIGNSVCLLIGFFFGLSLFFPLGDILVGFFIVGICLGTVLGIIFGVVALSVLLERIYHKLGDKKQRTVST